MFGNKASQPAIICLQTHDEVGVTHFIIFDISWPSPFSHFSLIKKSFSLFILSLLFLFFFLCFSYSFFWSTLAYFFFFYFSKPHPLPLGKVVLEFWLAYLLVDICIHRGAVWNSCCTWSHRRGFLLQCLYTSP